MPASGTYPPSCRAESGRSDLRGGLTSETVGQPFATLAAPPGADEWYPAVEANNAVNPLVVHPDGTAVETGGNNGFLSLENIRVNTSSSSWSNLALQNGWSRAPGVLAPSYHQDGSFVELRGGLNGGSIGQVIATLPQGLRPGADEWYSVVTANGVVGSLLVQASGNIDLNAGNAGFLALDGLRIPLGGTQRTALNLQNGWTQAPGVDTVAITADGSGFATLTGGTNGGGAGQVVANLPPAYRPGSDSWFSVVTANHSIAPLVVHPNGDIVLAAGNPGFLSLSGLRVSIGSLAIAPSVTTGPASQVAETSATVSGTVNPNGQATSYHFEYGTSNGYGSQTADQGAGSGSTNVQTTASLAALGANTTYHYRLDATNASGTTFGQDHILISASSGYSQAVGTTSGLSAYWRLSESSGTTVFDSLGQANGVAPAPFGYVGGPQLGVRGAIPNDPNRGVSFNGQGQYAGVPRAVQNDLSLEFWFNSKGGGAGSQDSQWWQGAGLVDGEVPGVVNDFGTSLDSTGQVWAGTGNPDTSIHSQAGLNDGNWHYVVFTRQQSTGKLTLYIDGLQVAQGTGGTQALTSPPQLRIAMLQSGVNPLPATIDDVAAYSIALSAQAVSSHFQQAGVSPPPPPSPRSTCPTGSWQNLSLENGAVPASGTYIPACQAETSRSALRGGLTSEPVGQPFATLAVPPAADQWFPAVEANGVLGPVVVHSNGNVVVSAGNNGFLSLENMRTSGSATGWSNLAPQNGWTQAPGMLAPSYHQDGSFVELRGGLNGGSSGQVIATLPQGLRPGADEWFTVVTANNVIGAVQVRSDGTITLHSGNPGFLALDSVRFPIAGDPAPLSFANGWQQAPAVDSASAVSDGNGFVTLSGGASGASIGQVITNLPPQWRPLSDVWFSVVTANNQAAPLVVHPNGDVVLTGGNPGFVSLAGIRLVTQMPTFSDEFNQTSVDTTKWSEYGPGAGNNGFGTRNPAQISESNGTLTITMNSQGVTGGMSGNYAQTQGTLAARVKTSQTSANVHAVLIWWPFNDNWPCGGEADYYEISDPLRQTYDGYFHFDCNNDFEEATNVSVDLTQWHVLAVQWTANSMAYYLDGRQVLLDTNPSHLPPQPLVPTIQLDLTDNNPITPGTMSVDWLREYAR